MVVKPRILKKANWTKYPHREKTMKETFILDVGGNPQKFILGKPIQSGRDWKPNPHSAPQWDSNRVPRGGGQGKKPLRQPDRPKQVTVADIIHI